MPTPSPGSTPGAQQRPEQIDFDYAADHCGRGVGEIAQVRGQAGLLDQPVQVRAHHLQLPLALGEADHPDVVACGELGDRLAEPQSDLLQDRRGRDREPRCWVRKLTTCPDTCRVGTHPVR